MIITFSGDLPLISWTSFREAGHLIPIEEVLNQLGITKKFLINLIKDGYLSQAREVGTLYSRRKFFYRNEVALFQEQLLEKARFIHNDSGSAVYVSFDKVAYKLRRYKLKKSSVLEAILKKELTPYFRPGEEKIGSMLFEMTELDTFRKKWGKNKNSEFNLSS